MSGEITERARIFCTFVLRLVSGLRGHDYNFFSPAGEAVEF